MAMTGLPKSLIRVHRWREDVITVGEVPAEFVARATEGVWTQPWPAQLNKLVWEGGHDLMGTEGLGRPGAERQVREFMGVGLAQEEVDLIGDEVCGLRRVLQVRVDRERHASAGVLVHDAILNAGVPGLMSHW